MSEHAARAALERMNLRPVAVCPHYGGLASDLMLMSRADPEHEQNLFMARRAELCAAYGFGQASTQDKPFAFANGLAFIPVSGSLVNRFGGSWSSVTGYNFIRSQMLQAEADSDVLGIVFDLNSYGGEAAGCFELAAEIAALSKPTLGVIDSNCYSACYAIGSAMDKLTITPSGGAGSIGVVAMHVSFEQMLSEAGIKVTFIHSGDHKVDGNPYMDLPDSVRKDIQAGVDASRQSFAELVATNRKMDVKAVLDTEARTYRADDALRLGLVDAIATPTEAVRAFFNGLSGSYQPPRKKETSMSATNESGAQQTAQPIDAAAVAAEAKKAERARVSGIQSCEEAKGREELANHLAMNTEMSVDEAKAILAVAPKQAAAATPVAAANPFQAAMNSGTNPNIGADASDAVDGTGQQLSTAQMILRDYAAATGRKFEAAKA